MLLENTLNRLIDFFSGTIHNVGAHKHLLAFGFGFYDPDNFPGEFFKPSVLEDLKGIELLFSEDYNGQLRERVASEYHFIQRVLCRKDGFGWVGLLEEGGNDDFHCWGVSLEEGRGATDA
jgi:hypothetical protein